MANRRLLGVCGWLGAIALLAATLALASNPILPKPATLLARIAELSQGPLWGDLTLTVLRSVAAFVIALCLGIAWAAVFPPRHARSLLAAPSLLLLQAAPVILWIVPLVLLLGTGNSAPIAASVFVVMPLIAFEFRAAFEMTSRERREFWRHYVPYYPRRVALRLYHEWRPHLASATGMGLLMSFKASVIAEWFAARDGIGRQLQQAFVVVDTASFLAYALAFLVAALALTALAQASVQHIGVVRTFFVNLQPSIAGRQQADVLRLENIGHSFGRRRILQALDLHLRPGEIVILTGASGSGKSTLARIAAGLLKPQTGQVIAPLRGICYVFQSDVLFPRESVAENAGFHLPPGNTAEAARAIALVGLEADLFAGNLSGGMRRRLALARGLATPATFLLLDEPFAGLDAGAVRQLLQVIADAARGGRGILLITHNVTNEMRAFADSTLAIVSGALQPVDVQAKPGAENR